MTIYEALNAEMQRIKGLAPAKFKQQVDDAEKRLNILFDALNNSELASATVGLLSQLAQAMQARDFDQAQALHTELIKQTDQGGSWAVSL